MIGYDYDAVGNRLTRSSSIAAVPSTTSAYDANDRLASDTYDANGSTTGSGGTVYRYDFENKIIALNPGTANQVTFVYDGDGNRVAKTVGFGASAVTTKFLVDTNSPTGYAQVAEEVVSSSSGSGSVQRTYVHGHSLISQTQFFGSPTPSWTITFYGMDGHGSVRFLTDGTGTITDSYDYDAFGILIRSVGTTPNNYLYVGEQLDANLAFYYLRTRFMNPSSGRFWSMDGFEGVHIDPFSLHKYLYANADGVNHSDPTGQFVGIADVSTASTVRGTLIKISVPIWQRVVAAVLIGVLVSGAIVGTGTKFEPNPRLNSMRVQLQEGHNHIDSQPKQNYDPPGVTVAQMRKALEEMFLRGKGLIPGHLESDYLGAIARTSIWLGEQPLTYTYDATGDLISFSDRETNTSTFTYNASHGLLTIRDPRVSSRSGTITIMTED